MNQYLYQNRAARLVGAVQNKGNSFVQAGQGLRNMLVLLCLVGAGLFSVSATAADADATSTTKTSAPISIHLKQFKVLKDEQGESKFVDAGLVLPGDVIEYRAIYSNQGKTALPVIATVPVPESMEYLKDSAKAKNNLAHTVALKDSQFANEPLLQKVVTASGATLSQPVPYASYRFVRWDLGRLAPGSSIEVSVRAKVAQNLEVDASAEGKTSVLASSSLKK